MYRKIGNYVSYASYVSTLSGRVGRVGHVFFPFTIIYRRHTYNPHP